MVFEGGDDETSVGLVTLFFFTEEEGFFVRGGGTGVYEEKNNTHLWGMYLADILNILHTFFFDFRLIPPEENNAM